MARNSWSSIHNINNCRLWFEKSKFIIHQPDVDNIYLYAKYQYEEKFQFVISKRKTTDLKHLNDSKTFIKYSDDIDDNYKNI